MLITVGTGLTLDGTRYAVTHITTSHTLMRANDSSDVWTESERLRHENVTYMHVDVETYQTGDLIERNETRLRLESPDRHHTHYIITSLTIKRRLQQHADTQGSTIGGAEAPDTTEGTGTGSTSTPGAWSPGAGEDSSTDHGIGPSGDPWTTSPPGVCEG